MASSPKEYSDPELTNRQWRRSLYNSRTIDYKTLRRFAKENPDEIKEKMSEYYRDKGEQPLVSPASYQKSFTNTINLPSDYIAQALEHENIPNSELRRSQSIDINGTFDSLSSYDDKPKTSANSDLVNRLVQHVKDFLQENSVSQDVIESVKLNVKFKRGTNDSNQQIQLNFSNEAKEWKAKHKSSEFLRDVFATRTGNSRKGIHGSGNFEFFRSKSKLSELDQEVPEADFSTPVRNRSKSVSTISEGSETQEEIDMSSVSTLTYKEVIESFKKIKKEGLMIIKKSHSSISKRVLAVLSPTNINFFQIKSDARDLFNQLTNKKLIKEYIMYNSRCITIDLLHTSIKLIDDRKFEIVTLRKKILCTTESEEEFQTWFQALSGVSNDLMLQTLGQKEAENEETASNGSNNDDPRNSSQYLLVKELWSIQGNQICADCSCEFPEWTSINLGILICVECSGVHRSLGVQISKVRSLTLDNLEYQQLETIRNVGNKKSNEIYEALLPLHAKIGPDVDKDLRKKFVVAKYERKLFCDPIKEEMARQKVELNKLKSNLIALLSSDTAFKDQLSQILSPPARRHTDSPEKVGTRQPYSLKNVGSQSVRLKKPPTDIPPEANVNSSSSSANSAANYERKDFHSLLATFAEKKADMALKKEKEEKLKENTV